ncbi:unnamed protein product [Sympodiomycopsis kandeliae]
MDDLKERKVEPGWVHQQSEDLCISDPSKQGFEDGIHPQTRFIALYIKVGPSYFKGGASLLGVVVAIALAAMFYVAYSLAKESLDF